MMNWFVADERKRMVVFKKREKYNVVVMCLSIYLGWVEHICQMCHFILILFPNLVLNTSSLRHLEGEWIFFRLFNQIKERKTTDSVYSEHQIRYQYSLVYSEYIHVNKCRIYFHLCFPYFITLTARQLLFISKTFIIGYFKTFIR